MILYILNFLFVSANLVQTFCLYKPLVFSLVIVNDHTSSCSFNYRFKIKAIYLSSRQTYIMLILESKRMAPLKFLMIISEATLSDICTMAAPSLFVRNLT